jgi:hypothetical protein
MEELPRLIDLSPLPLPFKAHYGKAMQDVPARYLLWLWNNGLWEIYKEPRTTPRHQVAHYIVENMASLESEDKDTIIQHRP